MTDFMGGYGLGWAIVSIVIPVLSVSPEMGPQYLYGC